MEGKEEPKRPDRKPKEESSKAKLFCDAYLSLGVERSIEKLSKMEIDGITVVKRWLEDWSRWYGWVERANAYDEEQLKRRGNTRQNALDKLYDELARTCREQLEKTWKDIDKLRCSDKGLGSIASVNLAKLLIDTQIQVLGGNEKQKIELTGKDSGPMDIEVTTFWGRGTDPRKHSEPVEEPSQQIEDEPEVSAEFGIDIPEDEE